MLIIHTVTWTSCPHCGQTVQILPGGVFHHPTPQNFVGGLFSLRRSDCLKTGN